MTSEPMTIMMSPSGGISNPYIDLLVESLPPDLRVVPFSWRGAFSDRYDVLHIHWPEAVMTGSTHLKQVAKLLSMSALTVLNRLRRRAHVWTMHNVTPHEGSRDWIHRLTLATWTRSCQAFVVLKSSDVALGRSTRTCVVKHGDYRTVVDPHRSGADPVPGRLLIFGRLRPYKGIEDLCEAVAGSRHTSTILRIVGAPMTDEYRASLTRTAELRKDIELNLGRVSDRELVHEIERCEAVILPYRQLGNSGAALMALSVGRPVIATASEAIHELRQEVGDEWVVAVSSPPRTGDVDAALERLRAAPRTGPPPFHGRKWHDAGLRHAALYRSLAHRRTGKAT